ncbi:MAG: hypothetical protein KC636_39840, partial [Myxococcales bacterium]|nr:hypothetical protein [Myxococcales bacterium]
MSSEQGWQGPSLRLVLGSVAVISIIMGVLAFRVYSRSERQISGAIETFMADGRELTADQCVTRVVDWYFQDCDANLVMCADSVTRAMGACLGAQDRTRECELLEQTGALDPNHGDVLAEAREHKVGSGQWVFYTCKARGTECQKRGKCPCADAVR